MSIAEQVGGGLVEISAVATIIGAPIAEILLHGLKGACGIVWAPMSTFGAIHVTKACLAAAIPDYLRDATGLSNEHVNAALGVALRVNPTKRARHRVDLGDARAIQSEPEGWLTLFSTGERHGQRNVPTLPTAQQQPTVSPPHRRRLTGYNRRQANTFYTLDKSLHLALDTVYATTTEKGEAVKVHRFEPDLAGASPVWRDWLVLTLSLAKLLEAAVLRKCGARKLWFFTCLGWSHAFVSAFILQLCGLGRDSVHRPSNDIVAGRLPSPLHLGGNGKIILHVPANVRRHWLWRGLLALGVLFNAVGLFGTFLVINNEHSKVIYIWVGFQVLWLVTRTVVYYFVEGAAGARQGVMLSMTWDETSDEDRERVLILLSGLSNQQVSIHPRGVIAYRNDCLDFQDLYDHFEQVQWKLETALSVPVSESRVWKLHIEAVAGDPVIRSAVWFAGAILDNSEMYDATVAFIRLGQVTIAVPCVRVWACDCLPSNDRSRGNAHPDCGMVKWLYFIPFTSSSRQGWILAHGLAATGLLMTELLSNEELDGRFQRSRYRISMQSLDDLDRALAVARSGVKITLDLIKSSRESHRARSESSISKQPVVTTVQLAKTDPSLVSPIITE